MDSMQSGFTFDEVSGRTISTNVTSMTPCSLELIGTWHSPSTIHFVSYQPVINLFSHVLL